MADREEPFNFEGLPVEIRILVYRELLLSPYEIDPVYGRDAIALHPAILCTSKNIHHEAITILYGENTFTSSLSSDHIVKLWHRNSSNESVLSRSASRRICRIHLHVNTSKMQGVISGIISINAGLAASKLALNSLTLLKVTVLDRHRWAPEPSEDGQLPVTSERNVAYLEPLKSLRAREFSINDYCSRIAARELKIIIEDRSDLDSWNVYSYIRKNVEMANESDVEERDLKSLRSADEDPDDEVADDDESTIEDEEDLDWVAHNSRYGQEDLEDEDEDKDMKDPSLADIILGEADSGID